MKKRDEKRTKKAIQRVEAYRASEADKIAQIRKIAGLD